VTGQRQSFHLIKSLPTQYTSSDHFVIDIGAVKNRQPVGYRLSRAAFQFQQLTYRVGSVISSKYHPKTLPAARLTLHAVQCGISSFQGR
jgi:hypothetical protein